MYLLPLLLIEKQTSPLTHSQVINIVRFIKNKFKVTKIPVIKYICTVFKRKGRGLFIFEIALTAHVLKFYMLNLPVN